MIAYGGLVVPVASSFPNTQGSPLQRHNTALGSRGVCCNTVAKRLRFTYRTAASQALLPINDCDYCASCQMHVQHTSSYLSNAHFASL